MARRFIRCKIANSRTMLRRNGEPTTRLLDDLAEAVERADGAESLEQLLGLEGNAARGYFSSFEQMLRPPPLDERPWRFDFNLRNRRPPVDPVNAMLSFAYSILTKELTLVVFLRNRLAPDTRVGGVAFVAAGAAPA
jgi:CRISP-associated protein Cas1